MLAKELAAILMKEPEAIVLIERNELDGFDGLRSYVLELRPDNIESEIKVKGIAGYYSATMGLEGTKVPVITLS